VPYKVLTGLSYPPNKRAEVGSVVDDIPTKSIKWLLEKGHIELVGAASSDRSEKSSSDKADTFVDSAKNPVSKKGEK
jgi:hypothetical protein